MGYPEVVETDQHLFTLSPLELCVQLAFEPVLNVQTLGHVAAEQAESAKRLGDREAISQYLLVGKCAVSQLQFMHDNDHAEELLARLNALAD